MSAKIGSRYQVLHTNVEDVEQFKSRSAKNKSKRNNKNVDSNDRPRSAAAAAKNKKSAKENRTKKLPKKVDDENENLEPLQEQWQQWKEKDQKYVEDAYHKDLQQALLQSKMEFEEHHMMTEDCTKDSSAENIRREEETSQSVEPVSHKKKGKTKKVMTLDEFNHMKEAKQPKQHQQSSSSSRNHVGAELEDDDTIRATLIPSQPKLITIKNEDKDETFFERIKDETKRIINIEHKKEKYKMEHQEKSGLSEKLLKDMSLKTAEIKLLNATRLKLENCLAEERDKNAQLTEIVEKGQMDVSVIQQLLEAQYTCNELTETVQRLQEELETERTNNKILQIQLENYKSKTVNTNNNDKQNKQKGKNRK